MEVNINKLRRSVQKLLQLTTQEPQDSAFVTKLNNFIKKKQYVKNDVERLFRCLSDQLPVPAYTVPLAVSFEEHLLFLLTTALHCDLTISAENAQQYKLESIALAKLLHLSEDAKRFAMNFFRNKPAPFEHQQNNDHIPSKKLKNDKAESADVSQLELIKCCYRLLKSDAAYFSDLWDWSQFMTNYAHTASTCMLTKLYCNHIMGILTNMNSALLHTTNSAIPTHIHLQFEEDQTPATQLAAQHTIDYLPDLPDQLLVLPLKTNQAVTYVEGVLLPIFNKENQEFYASTDGCYERIVKVDSTIVNLRSIALGIAATKPVCLSGPVGCGKTTLVEYLARKTGRICPKPKEKATHEQAMEAEEFLKPKNNSKPKQLTKNAGDKRKHAEAKVEDLLSLVEDDVGPKNGFLRIQLGDQTDSKMLLGQYRCTDVPGEFIWLPGVLTQAVMNGYWLLLEDLDAATPDTYTILSSLLERNYLSVPGFRDCVKIEPGFQLFVTVRTNKSASNSAQKSLYSLLDKYLYTINILPLSRNELCKVISTNYPKLTTVANRIVDVFLTFSSGHHTAADNLRQQETGDKADTTEQYVALPFEQVTLSSLPNSGRLVSTRDLIKLCQRSNPQFSVTSSECAYFVFQNAVDVFCSYLPQSREKVTLISSIGAKLGIIRSRCEHFSNDYKPEVEIGADQLKIGRAVLHAKEEEPTELDAELEPQAQKRQKLLNQASKKLLKAALSKRSTFSFTRLASCILERIAVCVAHSEPVLLVGETGVGKTSSVQYLAERTNHKLVVVNMNNQSDVSDLIGGFKPVELNYVLAPLRYEFERLFCETFNAEKNMQFLKLFATHFSNGKDMVIIKTMIGMCETVLNKTDAKLAELLPQWQLLQGKLMKLHTQLEKAINISFAFIPGSLVNCIRNGDWVLLDEINLASAETLECLSTILEPEGSVVLLECGDFTPVQRHAEFRIFACMNPNTDIGKKDLPVGIRNRFTEFFVDELTTDADLSLLVADYLNNTGIQRKSVHSIVQLYKSLKRLSELQLNDGLGNRPVYSLRTLCRSLRICAKNLCGSIERNLYESFCLSFLTQLDPESHNIVLLLITDALVRNAKAVLAQPLPQLGDNFLPFEGYWIQRGTRELQECAHYILTSSVRSNLKDLARIISIGKLPILLQGPTSAGKTSLIDYVARRSGNHCLRINNHEHTDLQEYIGTYAADETGKLSFQEGVLVQAMRHGYWIILDELNLASTDILEALNRVLDDNRELFIAETQTVVKAHPNFMLFATQNPPGLYGGRKTLSRAFKNRFIELHFGDIPRPELEIILEQRCLIPPSYAKKMVLCMSELQKNRKTTTKNVFTLRDLFRWGNRYTHADKTLLDDAQYDWNQHLIEEGYLVLSAKVRTPLETEIIEETLYRNFRKRIQLPRLFDVQAPEPSSPVTRQIIEAIRAFRQQHTDIVWTLNMTRMAVLTAKALQFDEPVLLVGPTGCGKTTVCQLLATMAGVQLRILNCHMHTEGADFLGGLRPCRTALNGDSPTPRLFEWADGPLIYAMQQGSYFMADEISLAEDSVLERLNCILEPERTVLLAEKGGLLAEATNAEFVVQAQAGFQFLATMNPGGDFGKKELSPALRNRFTEIWCLPSDTKADLTEIAYNCMRRRQPATQQPSIEQTTHKIAEFLVEIVLHLRRANDKFRFSVRDILAWANYMISNAQLSFAAQAIFGLETIFLDALEMLPYESPTQIEHLKLAVTQYAIEQAASILHINFSLQDVAQQRGQQVVLTDSQFGIEPFYMAVNPERAKQSIINRDFCFDAPTTKQNLFRLLSALTLQKPVLLEGPPGVGKTSIVESMAHAIGYQLVRINLCEHTDLADLFGTDLPAEDRLFEETNTAAVGGFVWRDGPLLAALKAPNSWILLDELNLAPQSVLEGLNAVLDHRGEVYIPELNKSFQLHRHTRIFACQNPLKQGGGRKGLPQSFLNRFNKVYLRQLTTADLLHVVNLKYATYFSQLATHFSQLLAPVAAAGQPKNLFDIRNKGQGTQTAAECGGIIAFDLAERLVQFSELLDRGVSAMEFGYKGGPYEFNLRDILRWCELLQHPETGYIMQAGTLPSLAQFERSFEAFLLTLYERMKLVYYQRMRCPQDQLYIRNAFGRIFNCNAEQLHQLSEDVCLYWTPDKLYLNDVVLPRLAASQQWSQNQQSQKPAPLLLTAQRQLLKQIVETVHMEKPLLLCGASDSGKTKLIDALCLLSNHSCNTDTIDDSVTGSFQQIDLNRHLEQVASRLQHLVLAVVQSAFVQQCHADFAGHVWSAWSAYNRLANITADSTGVSAELQLFAKRLLALQQILIKLEQTPASCRRVEHQQLAQHKQLLMMLQQYTSAANSLNTGGSFEWVDSQIVKSLRCGQYLLLEHVNLCSSAVLDRLNPVFEPQGQLLIAEKGISGNDSAEIVPKSANFRAFLTIDPKNGELSRAMRNRCVELALHRDAYTQDDMRAIVHSQGVRQSPAIDCMLRVHRGICQLTELNPYSVSHLTQFAFLTAAYRRIGYELPRAIYVAAMEVYVYAATMDLMGYGLAYYQNKLRDVVLHETSTELPTPTADADRLSDVILSCDNLHSLSLIKLQAAPLQILLQAKPDQPDQPNQPNQLSSQLSALFCDMAQLQLSQLQVSQLSRCYLYVLYEASAMNELQLRHLYLQRCLAAHAELRQLSNSFHDCLSQQAGQCGHMLPDLPWQSRLLPRLRDYAQQSSNSSSSRPQAELALSAALLARLLLLDIPQRPLGALHELDALQYSQALAAETVTEKYSNAFLANLASLLQDLHASLLQRLSCASFELPQFAGFISKLQWFNRLLQAAQQPLLQHNALPAALMHKLVLHFHWLQKHLLQPLQQQQQQQQQQIQLPASLQAMSQYVEQTKRPLNVLGKVYAKQFMQFQPYYCQQQIVRHEQCQQLQRLLQVVPQYGSVELKQVRQVLAALKTEEAKKWRTFVRVHTPPCTFKQLQLRDSTDNDNDKENGNPHELELDVDVAQINALIQADSGKTIKLKPFELLLDTLREYFMRRVLNSAANMDLPEQLNPLYCEQLLTLNAHLWQCLNTLQSKQHNSIRLAWQQQLAQWADAEAFPAEQCSLKGLRSYQRQYRHAWQCYQLENLATRFDCLQADESELQLELELDSRYAYNGPALLNVILALIFKQDGKLQPVPLHELDSWRACLEQTRQLLWHNAPLLTQSYSGKASSIEQAQQNAQCLLRELDYVRQLPGNSEPINAAFEQARQALQLAVAQLTADKQAAADSELEQSFDVALTNTLTGALELCLLTHTPLIDPVEKNRLKHQYMAEDIECLSHLSTAYDLMKIAMQYKHYGQEIYAQLQQQLLEKRQRQQQFAQKLALRPAQCLYSQLVQDVLHFVRSNCDLSGMLRLIAEIRAHWQHFVDAAQPAAQPAANSAQLKRGSGELLQKLQLWLVNAQRFVEHTLSRYSAYYQDFMQPLQCAVNQMRYGLEQLKTVFTQAMLAGSVAESRRLQRTLCNIVEFPSVQPLELQTANVYGLLMKLPHCDHDYFRLLKVKLMELRNSIALAQHIDEANFAAYDFALNICNQTWQKEEQQRRQQQADAESLYVTKTRGGIEDEQLEELQAIETHFPTNIEQDFGEFVTGEATLAKVLKLDKQQLLSKSKLAQLISEQDYGFLARNFIETMTQHTPVSYAPANQTAKQKPLQLLASYQLRLQVFVKLYAQYKTGLAESLDAAAYNSLTLAVALQQRTLKDLLLELEDSRGTAAAAAAPAYDFYKHSNMTEVIGCSDVLDRIEARVLEQLELYPEHAGLADIRLVITRIRELPSTAPVVRFNTGFQLLRQKLALWNELAHRHNHLQQQEIEVAEHVQRWTKLELQHWRNCLAQVAEQAELHACRYWFFIYNLVQQFIGQRDMDQSYTQLKLAEQRFAHEQILDEAQLATKSRVLVPQLIGILRQFVEAASYGDFHVRLQLLHAFEMYLHNVARCQAHGKQQDELQALIAGLHNLQLYFAQFAQQLAEANKSRRAPIEKKLREFVKIQSYTKDLSYFSMRHNVATVHRNLSKFLKEYRLLLQEKITAVFQPQDATVKDYKDFSSDKGKNLRYYNKIKYFTIDRQHFIAAAKLREKYNLDHVAAAVTAVTAVVEEQQLLLQRLGKHFAISRSIVKQALSNMQYPELINALDELLAEQLERCEQLRQLNVDRSKPRPKQKLEAKQILQQKRKALTDLFKTLMRLGVNYKTGLMELSLRDEFENFQLPPFCIKSMLCARKEQRLHPNALPLNEHLHLYYMKCVFKLKLLQNIMLTPLPELGPPNIERIKGFAVDMFLLVQQQRHLLASSTQRLHQLRDSLKDLRHIADIVAVTVAVPEQQLNFAHSHEQTVQLKAKLCQMHYVLKQFQLLLECAPLQQQQQQQQQSVNCALAEQDQRLLQGSPHYSALQQLCDKVLKATLTLLTELAQQETLESQFISHSRLQRHLSTYQSIIADIRQAINILSSASGEQLPPAQPLLALLAQLDDQTAAAGTVGSEQPPIDCSNIDAELCNITHSVLLALQKIYKKYPKLEAPNTIEQEEQNKSNEEQYQELQEQHLKQRLCGELSADWQLLAVERIIAKLSNVLLVLKHANATAEKLACLRKAVALLPLLEQYQLLADYFLLQQLATHKVSAKMLSVMLTVFVEIGTKGFCVPPDLMQDEDEDQSKQESKTGEGFGLEDGTGENDASDKIESEDQLDDAKKPEDRQDDGNNKEEPDCKEEKGIEMSDDFDGKMQDVDKPEEDDSGESEQEEELNKEMGETEEGAEKLDEQIWGDDEEEQQQEEEEEEQPEQKEEEQGKGTKDEKDEHNDLDAKNDAAKEAGKDEHDKDGLDATNEPSGEDKRKQQANDIDDMQEADQDEEQTNAQHNELEEPPEPEEMDLGDMNNVDEGRDDEKDEQTADENPFDIDVMKENMPPAEETEADDAEDADQNNDDKGEDSSADSESEDEAGPLTEPPHQQGSNDNEDDDGDDGDDDETVEPEPEEPETQKRGELDNEKEDEETPAEQEEAEKREEKPEEHAQSKDKSSKQENVQSVPETDQNSSADQVEQAEQKDEDIKQNQKMDEQETGEEKDGVGQAEHDNNDEGGHQGVAETQETVSQEERKNERQTQEKRKQGRTNEERTLGEADQHKLKQLKTIDKLEEAKENAQEENDKTEQQAEEAEEYQHVKQPKSSDKTTLDNATEEQAKQIQHQDEDEEEQQVDDEGDMENPDEPMETEQPAENQQEDAQLEQLSSEKLDKKSDKPAKSEQTTKERLDMPEEMEIEGEVIATQTVPRSAETTAHSNTELLLDKSMQAQELSAGEQIELRQMYQQQLSQPNVSLPQHADFEAWQSIANRMTQNARELCEQLRLILEPTKCTRLKGDYRTGRRINMKKIIPYIASQFRKDKIWLRRTKPAQRDYKITIAIDDSKSMHHNNSKTLTLEAISLVSQALTLLESGRLSIVSFGEAPKIVLNHTEQFDGPRLVSALNFAQDKTKIASLLDFIRTVNSEEGTLAGDNGLFENLLLIMSDGRNIYSEGNQKVKNAIKLARLQRIFLVYIIIDNPDNKNSILDIQNVEMNADGTVNINSYLDGFPFPYYVIVRDLNQLPLVLSEAMRQWFELVNSEQ